jgi:hypothetical protein
MITIKEEEGYLEDKPYYYREGWRDCSKNFSIRKFTSHTKKDSADYNLYNLGYGDCIANSETDIDFNFNYERGEYMNL